MPAERCRFRVTAPLCSGGRREATWIKANRQNVIFSSKGRPAGWLTGMALSWPSAGGESYRRCPWAVIFSHIPSAAYSCPFPGASQANADDVLHSPLLPDLLTAVTQAVYRIFSVCKTLFFSKILRLNIEGASYTGKSAKVGTCRCIATYTLSNRIHPIVNLIVTDQLML